MVVEQIKFQITVQDLVDIGRDFSLEGIQNQIGGIVLQLLLLKGQVTGALQSTVSALHDVGIGQIQGLVDFRFVPAHQIFVAEAHLVELRGESTLVGTGGHLEDGIKDFDQCGHYCCGAVAMKILVLMNKLKMNHRNIFDVVIGDW